MGTLLFSAQTYKPADEVSSWRERDPLNVAGKRITERGLATVEDLARLDAEAAARIDAAEAFARSSPYPDTTEAYTDVYSD